MRSGTVTGAALLVAVSLTVSAQAPPDFSGTWKMSAEKSNFGEMPAPENLQQIVTHSDPQIRVQSTQTGDFGEWVNDFTFTTDGNECQNASGDIKIRSNVTWQGPQLHFDSTMDFQGSSVKVKDTWSLSPDGTELTIDRVLDGGQGESKAKIVLLKQ